jgi:hypothetical protein
MRMISFVMVNYLKMLSFEPYVRYNASLLLAVMFINMLFSLGNINIFILLLSNFSHTCTFSYQSKQRMSST